jgi:serine/threonine protein phosphatase 1
MVNHTNGHRIYAIGDVHGCLEQLLQVQNNIKRDLQNRSHENPVTVYLGDYCDRGPNSFGVIENLIEQSNAPHQTHMLYGNHDDLLLSFRKDPSTLVRPNGPRVDKYHWLDGPLGGSDTLRSYGVEGVNEREREELRSDFLALIPNEHVNFFESLELHVRIGSYLFIHAGVNPGAPLKDQTLDDHIWIREPFLSSKINHGFIVVHGHTPTQNVDNRGNRIGVDTGACFGGKLSCLVLEDNDQGLLTDEGVVPCPVSTDISTQTSR